MMPNLSAIGQIQNQSSLVRYQRFDGHHSGDREVQRTMLELVSQLGGFSSHENVRSH